MAADPVALAAARLLGLDRPHRRSTDNDLATEAEYRLRAAARREGIELPDVTKCGTVRDVKQWIADAERAIPIPF